MGFAPLSKKNSLFMPRAMILTILFRSMEAATPSVKQSASLSTPFGETKWVIKKCSSDTFKCRPHTLVLAGLAHTT